MGEKCSTKVVTCLSAKPLRNRRGDERVINQVGILVVDIQSVIVRLFEWLVFCVTSRHSFLAVYLAEKVFTGEGLQFIVVQSVALLYSAQTKRGRGSFGAKRIPRKKAEPGRGTRVAKGLHTVLCIFQSFF
jgi:hypothetical protein